MPSEVTVSCATCGGDVELTLHSDGKVEGGHYAGVIVANESKVVEGATTVEDHLEDGVGEQELAVIYTECGDCCPKCNDE